jgi:hypothetical protein
MSEIPLLHEAPEHRHDLGQAPVSSVSSHHETVLTGSLTRQSDFHHLDRPRRGRTWTRLLDFATLAWLFARVATSDRRSREQYSSQLCGPIIQRALRDRNLAHEVNWTYGPWMGADVSVVSYHHAGKFFQKDFWHGLTGRFNDAWFFLNRPIQHAWFDPWVTHLRSQGVRFAFRSPVRAFLPATPSSTLPPLLAGVEVEGMGVVRADHYVVCMNPFMTRNLLHQSPKLLEHAPGLACFDRLTRHGPHIQISFRMAFRERIRMPMSGPTTAIAYLFLKSAFDITLCVQDEFWPKGSGTDAVGTLWSGTACLARNPGPLFGLPMTELTQEQFVAEVENQVFTSPEFRAWIQRATKTHDSDPRATHGYLGMEVWSEWWGRHVDRPLIPRVAWIAATSTDMRDGEGTAVAVKWVNHAGTLLDQPGSSTELRNLWLAGAHTATSADLWSMEAAVESGRHAADLISGKSTVIRQKPPRWLSLLQMADNVLYAIGLPQLCDFLLITAILLILWTVLS